VTFNNFNLLRLLAALQVVYIHSVEHLKITNEIILMIKNIIAYFPGVPIFFLISGYLITMSYEKNQNKYEYIRNRALRILPGLYVSFIIGLVILWCFDQFKDVLFLDILLWTFAQLTLFQFYNPEFIRDFGVGVINGSLWTISVELTFYIILPFIYIFLKRDFLKRFLFLLFLSLIFYYYMQYISTNTLIYEKLIKSSILPYLFYFLFGLYIYSNQFEKYISNKVFIYLSFYIMVLFFQVNFFVYDIFKQIIFSLFIFSFVFSYRILSYRLMKHNDFTYGIYIYHMLIVNVFVELGYQGGVKNLFLVLMLSIVSGVLSYFLIERPFLTMKKKSLYSDLNAKDMAK